MAEKTQTILADLSEIPCPFGARPHAERVETGSLQINDDWPGVFIRGDNALAYAMYLEMAINQLERQPDQGNMDMFIVHTLKDLAKLLQGCRV